ncbi:shikimate dehydrogenase family protein [Arthrobacter pigmenti]
MAGSAHAAVLGSPIGHSKSPALHSAAYRHLGVDIGYQAIEMTPERLGAFMDELRDNSNCRGLSVTMPLKSAMVQHVDRLAESASALGVLNTVTFDDDGSDLRLTGHNTDVVGIIRAIRHAGGTVERSAAILGAGGTSLAATAALSALGIEHLWLCVRDPARAAETVRLAEASGMQVSVVALPDSAAVLHDAKVVVSTLPPYAADRIAALPGLARPVAGGAGILLDVAYEPWPSALARTWRERGGVIVPGLEMLLYQGVEQVRMFTGSSFHDEAGVINAMCDAVGLPRRDPRRPDMAG